MQPPVTLGKMHATTSDTGEDAFTSDTEEDATTSDTGEDAFTSDTGEDATTSDTGEDAFTSDMYNRRLLAFYVPTLPVWYLFLASLTASYMPSSVAQRVFVAFTISCKLLGSAHHEHRTYTSIARA